MKRILAPIIAAAISIAAHGATLVPIQLLNPAGSTSGQTIVSAGAASSPAWGNMVVANVTGAAALTGATFTGPVNINDNIAAPIFVLTDTTPGDGAQIALTGDGAATPTKTIRVAAGQFGIVNNSFSTQILTLTDAGILSTSGGINGTPISGSTGAFTTLSASSTVTVPAGTTLNQPLIVGVTNGSAAAAGNVGQPLSTTVPSGSAVALTGGIPANIGSLSLTAGDWDVWANMCTNPAGTTTQQTVGFSVSTASATMNVSQEVAMPYGAAAGNSVCAQVPMAPLNVSTTTTVFMVALSNFSVATNSAFGNLWARRRH